MILTVPLALLSFAFFKITRFVMGGLVSSHMKKHPEDARTWRVLSRKTLNTPIALPVIMTSAPRWNPHALISTVGPFPVSRGMRIRMESAQRSAAAWTIVIYSMPGRKTVASIGSLDGVPADGWRTVALQSGRYGMAVRYYGWRDEVELPEVEVDGATVVASVRQPSDGNNFYEDLKGRDGAFLKALQYYAWVMVYFRNYLSTSFVEKNYLPVGNPETEFFYGALRPGEQLRIELDSPVLRSFNVYLTVYNVASFPILWHSVREAPHITARMTEKASYLIRVHRTASDGPALDRKWVRATTIKEMQ